MITRRNVLVLGGLAALTGCSGPAGPPPNPLRAIGLVSADLPRAAADEKALAAAVKAVTAFSAHLFAALGQTGQQTGQTNLVCSPYSVAAALGMTVQGAAGETAAQMLATLHSTGASDLADGLNAVALALTARSRTLPALDGEKPGRVELATANALFGQRGVQW